MVVLTTVLGMIPLLTDPFFRAMAVCIMFGLTCAAVLSLIVTPVLYAIFFGVRGPDRGTGTREEALRGPAHEPERQAGVREPDGEAGVLDDRTGIRTRPAESGG
jgi:hypothetical protein